MSEAQPEVKPVRTKKPAATLITVHASDITRGSQSVELHEILEYKGNKLKLIIKSDAYKFQCVASITVFHPIELRWNELVSIPFGLMKIKEGLVYFPAGQGSKPNLEWFRDLFKEDRDELIRRMKMIL